MFSDEEYYDIIGMFILVFKKHDASDICRIEETARFLISYAISSNSYFALDCSVLCGLVRKLHTRFYA